MWLMYTPRPFLIEDFNGIQDFVARYPSITLVTIGRDGTPLATLLPAVWDSPKLSQNRPREDQETVMWDLSHSAKADEQIIAAEILRLFQKE